MGKCPNESYPRAAASNASRAHCETGLPARFAAASNAVRS